MNIIMDIRISHEHPHEHRGMKEITEIIQKSEMTVRAKKMAMRVFGIFGAGRIQSAWSSGRRSSFS